MKIFSKIYLQLLQWAKSKYAVYYLAAVSIAESIFFPVPPDIMLAPMALARPNRAWFYSGITTITSVLGGVIGYTIGAFAFTSLVYPILLKFNYLAQYHEIVTWYGKWGVWVVFLAGFSPIPYKLFTVSSGAFAMPLIPFILASAVARGTRFYLVAWLMRVCGAKIAAKLHKIIDYIGWVCVLLIVFSYLVFHYN